jgi:hypothetical protein
MYSLRSKIVFILALGFYVYIQMYSDESRPRIPKPPKTGGKPLGKPKPSGGGNALPVTFLNSV